MYVYIISIFRYVKTASIKLTYYLGCRRLLSCWIKIFLLLFLFTMLCTRVMFGNTQWLKDQSSAINPRHIAIGKFIAIKNGNETETAILKPNQDILSKIDTANVEQTIFNKEIYGPLKDDSLVLLVQVR